MRQLEQMISALLGTVATEIAAAVVGALVPIGDALEKGSALRQEQALNAVLGSRLLDVLHTAHAQIVVTAAKKLEAVRRHPGYKTTLLSDTLDDAEARLHNAITGASSPPTPRDLFAIYMAGTLVAAITRALGGECFSNPKQKKSLAGYPVKRRRRITAADFDNHVAQIILKIADSSSDDDSGLQALSELSHTRANLAGTITKIVTLLEGEDSEAHVRHMAYALMSAGHVLREPSSASESGVIDARVEAETQTSSASSATLEHIADGSMAVGHAALHRNAAKPTQFNVRSTNGLSREHSRADRSSIAERIRPKHEGVARNPTGPRK